MQPELAQDPRWILVQRVATSRNFKSSPRLRDFLLYAAECAIRDAPEDATEQQIGIKIFGRPAGYNSSEDSIVRSHARLLRQKLDAYFESEGAGASMRIDVPKGHYLVVFTQRELLPKSSIDILPPVVTVAPTSLPDAEPLLPALAHPAASKLHRWLPWLVVGIAACAIAVASFLLIPTSRVNRNVATLWRPFLTSGDPPLLIYSNGVFVGDSKTGMRYATREEIQRPPAATRLIDHYTGIGEVVGVYQLTQLFDAAHASFILKRSHLVTWDEARLRNLIFIGSPAENLAVRALPADTEFTLVSTPDEAGYRVNHPRAGEPAAYMRAENPLGNDYAIVSYLPGVQSGKKMMMLSGLTTLGTEAAVGFATRPESAAELLKAATGSDGQLRPFEALLETTVIGGVPLQTRLVTIYVH